MSFALTVARGQPLALASPAEPAPPDLGSMSAALRRRSFGIVLTMCTAALLAAALIALLPRSYQAQTKILVRVGREQIAPLEQSGTRFGNFILNQRAETTNDEVEMLRRPQLMDAAFPKLAALLQARAAAEPSGTAWQQHLRTRVTHALEEAWAPVRAVLEQGGLLTHQTEAEALRARFVAALDVAVVRETNILLVGFTWNDPVFAAEALNVFTETYRQEHVRLENNVKGMVDLYTKQAARTEADLAAATRELDGDLADHGASDPAAERQVVIAQLQSLEHDVSEATTATQQITQQLDSYRAKFAQTADWPETVALGSAMSSGLSDIDARHVDLVVARDRLLTQFRPEARQVQDINGQLAHLRQTKFDALQHALETRRTAEQQRLSLAQQKMGELRERLDGLTRSQHRVTELQERRDQLIGQLKTYRGQAEYLTLQEELNKQGLTSVTVLGAATPPTTASAPHKGVILALSVTLSALLALGYAAIAELRDTKLRDARQVGAILGLPVLATVSRA